MRQVTALLYGHRGAPASGVPENTIASFQRALDVGVSAIETDAHLSRDGHVMLSHDPDLTRVFNVALTIREHTRAELPQLPTLRELLSLVPRTMPINVDIKQHSPQMERAIIDAVGDDAPRVTLASFSVDVVNRVRALGYRGPVALSRQDIVRLFLPRLALKVLPSLRGRRAQVPLAHGRLRFDTRGFIKKCHAMDIKVDYWTINDVDTARRLLELGADGIMTDDPALLRPLFDV